MANNIENYMLVVERTGSMLYILKLVPGMLIVKITGMLYIRHHKIRILRFALCNK